MSRQSIKNEAAILDLLYEVILQRKNNPGPKSYVASLFIQGTEKIHAKIAEEAGELIEASELSNRADIVWEAADLIFHTLVLLGKWDIAPQEIYSELARRWGISGIAEKELRNLKPE